MTSFVDSIRRHSLGLVFAAVVTVTFARAEVPAQSIPEELSSVLKQPWKLTTDEQSCVAQFQFEINYVVKEANKKLWVRRLVVERDGDVAGLLMLSENQVVWGQWVDDVFLLLSPDEPGKYRLLRGGQFKADCGLSAAGAPSFIMGSATAAGGKSKIYFDTGAIAGYLLSGAFKIKPEGSGVYTFQRDGKFAGLLELAPQGEREAFAFRRIGWMNSRDEGYRIKITLDEYLAVRPLTPETPGLTPKVSAELIELAPDSGPVLQFQQLISQIRDGDSKLDAAGRVLLERCKTVDPAELK